MSHYDINHIVFSDDVGDNMYFSNRYEHDIIIDGNKFISVEHYMLYRKAVVYGDTEAAERILKCTKTKELLTIHPKAQVTYAEDYWEVEQNIALLKGVSEKFSEESQLTALLCKAMGEFIFLSDDTYLGLKVPDNAGENIPRNSLIGKNMLGKTLNYVKSQRQIYMMGLLERYKKFRNI